MKNLLDTSKLNLLLGNYRSGKVADCIKDPDILRQMRMRRRQLGSIMTAHDTE